MHLRDDLPRPIREVEHLWIPLADGTRLAARLWLPADAHLHPVPALLEYLPYRKRDGTRWRDEPMHRWFAGHGLAALRVDLRGTGESEGILLDEYLPQEQADGAEVIAWIARQPWCTGAVGMLGKSWGGFNALQVAALAPPALRAVVTVCASDDRYADDAHAMGGCLLNENLTWGAMLFTLAALPPDPELFGAGWRAAWLARLEAVRCFPAVWLEHPLRDAYWRQGSVSEDPRAIRCPVLAVGGWADGYTNAVPRLLASLDVPRRGLVGPWGHRYPHNGMPGPAIGFLQEARRFFARWLEDGPDEVEPFWRVWMQASARPDAKARERDGRWVVEPAWPPRDASPVVLHLREGGTLADGPDARGRASVRSPETVGAAGGAWCAFGLADLPRDQGEDDAASLVFDSQPLDETLEILGAPVVELELASDRARAQLAVRLCEVFPDGASARVTYGVLDLTHAPDHASAAALEPGRPVRRRLALNDVAHAFASGSRVRLALSTAYWPIVWPAPDGATLTLATPNCRLELPRRAPRPEDATLRPFEPPEAAPPDDVEDVHRGGLRRERRVDPTTGEVSTTTWIDVEPDGEPSRTRYPALALESGHAIVERFSIRPDDPLSARAEVRQTIVLARAAGEVRVETRLELSADAERFHLRGALMALENGREVFERNYRADPPRALRLPSRPAPT